LVSAVAEVVGAELQLEAVRGARQRRRHDAGVVDQQAELAPPVGGEGADRLETGQVEPADLGRPGHRRGGRLALVGVAHGQDHARAGRRQRLGRRAADAAVGAGHDHAAAGQVRDVDGAPSCHRQQCRYRKHAVNDNFGVALDTPAYRPWPRR
jgi:hypothetical protein